MDAVRAGKVVSAVLRCVGGGDGFGKGSGGELLETARPIVNNLMVF